MTIAQLLPYPRFKGESSTGDALSGGKLYSYEPGTTTPKATYTTYDASVANANPVILDANGEAVVYTDGSYKFVLTDSNDVVQWTMDNVRGWWDSPNDSFYYPDYTAADQGVTGDSNTIKYYVDQIGTDVATIVLQRGPVGTTTTYTLTTAETIPQNITLKFEDGAVLDGAGILTHNGSIEANMRQIFGVSFNIIGSTQVKEAYPEWWGAIANDATDDTDAIQAAVDFGYNSNADVILGNGEYYTTGFKVYGIYTETAGYPTRLRFTGGSRLKMTATGFAIRTWRSPTATMDTNVDQLLFGLIDSAYIDMDSNDGAGIMLEATHAWNLIDCFVNNIPSGTYSYTDKYSYENPGAPGLETYPNCGYAVKGVNGYAASLRNTFTRCWAWGVDRSSPYTGSGIGFWMGTTRGFTSQSSNHNRYVQCYARYQQVGFDGEEGGNNTMQMPDASNCDIGLRSNMSRFQIFQGYFESCGIGIQTLPFIAGSGAGFAYPTGGVDFGSGQLNQSGANYTYIQGYASKASTTTALDDQAPNTLMTPEDQLARYTAFNANGGMADQTITPATWTQIEFDSIQIDQGDQEGIATGKIRIDSGGNGEGWYTVIGTARIGVVDGKKYQLAIYKNGAQIYPGEDFLPGSTDTVTLRVETPVYLEKSDYVELWIYNGDSSNATVTSNARTTLSATKQVTYVGKPFNR